MGNTYESDGGLVGSTCGMTIWSAELTADYISQTYLNQTGLEADSDINDEDKKETSIQDAGSSQGYTTSSSEGYCFINIIDLL